MLQKTLVLLPLHDAGDYMILVCDNQIHVLCETPQKHKDKSRENLDEIKKKVKECSFCGNDNDRGNMCFRLAERTPTNKNTDGKPGPNL